MRRLATAPLITVLSAALLTAGCSGGSDGTPPEATPTPSASADTGSTAGGATVPEPTAEDVAALEAVTVDGDLGAAPTLTFDQPFAVSAPVARLDTEGTGDALAGTETLDIDYVAVSGDDGSVLASTWDQGRTQALSLADPQIISALTDVLTGQKVGVRVLFAAPGVAATETAEAAPATIMAIEVVEAREPLARAEGAAVTPPDGLPVVTLADDGEPEIEVPQGTVEPAALVVQPLIQGTGATVESGQQITVHYKGWLWDGTVFDTSWDGAPFPTPIGVGQVIPGWDEGLVGQQVGSQVLLVVPADKAYGADGTDGIPPNATLIFVVDILDAG